MAAATPVTYVPTQPITIPSPRKSLKLPYLEKIKLLVSDGQVLLIPKTSFSNMKKPIQESAIKNITDKTALGCILIRIDALNHNGKFTTLSHSTERNLGKGGFQTLQEAVEGTKETDQMLLEAYPDDPIVYNEIRIDHFAEPDKK